MFSDITNALKYSVSSCLDWLIDIWSSIDSTVIILFFTFFSIFTFVRLILFPLIGNAIRGSDRVKNTKTKPNNKKGG